MILTEDELTKVTKSIERTWQMIGPDVLASVPRISNTGAIESVIDANHMSTYNGLKGKEAEDLVTKMVMDAGYGPTLRYLARKIKLN